MVTQTEFAAIYDEYADAIFRFCFYKVHDRELAKDHMQDTFSRAWKYVASGKEVENMRALLYRIATNLIIDHVRKQKRRPTVALDELMEAGFEPGEDRSEQMTNQLDAEMALKVLSKLNDKERNLIMMRYVEDLPVNEIAVALGARPNAVSVRLNRALKKLRNLLENDK